MVKQILSIYVYICSYVYAYVCIDMYILESWLGYI